MVDGRVDLDRVGDVVGRRERVDRALRGGDDADREQALLAEQATDRGDELATTRLESPSGTGETAWSAGSTFTKTVSLKRSQPTIEPGIRSPSWKTTYTRSAPRTVASSAPEFVTTCRFVRMWPSEETMKPDPWAAGRSGSRSRS